MPNVKWTLETLLAEADKYITRVEFIKFSRSAYQKMQSDYPDMLDSKFPKVEWTLENCILEARKYSKRSDFRKKSSRAHDVLKANHFDIYTEIFPSAKIRSFETILESAKEFSTRKEFRSVDPNGYRALLKHPDGKSKLGKLFPLVKDMPYDMLKTIARKYPNREQLAKGSRQVYRQLKTKYATEFDELMPVHGRGKQRGGRS